MVEQSPQTKQDEQYPLLKVDGGGGDGGINPQPVPTLVTPGWGVTCTPKQTWLLRWPEYISACWMTLILLGISVLVFYALGIEAYRRQPVLLIKCNGSKPASDVFFHQIIPRGSSTPIMLYAEYLSSMAYQYPMLHFHVYFLIDDSVLSPYRVSRHPRFMNTLITMPLPNSYTMTKIDENTKRELAEFQNKYRNINVTTMPLSKYMAMTPLKYKWRNIPLTYLTFYARVFSVWQYGGVGMDLSIFNNFFNNRQHINRRICAILRQHNDGIKPEAYTNALRKIDRQEECEYFSMLTSMIELILNETRTFITKSLQFSPVPTEKDSPNKNESLIRVHRNKRDVPIAASDDKVTTDKSPVFVETLNSTNATDLKKNEYHTITLSDSAIGVNTTKTAQEKNSSNIENINLRFNQSEGKVGPSNKTDHSQLVLFYDFAVFTDSKNIPPSMDLPDPLMRSDINTVGKDSKPMRYSNPGSYLLSIDSDGMFVAASAGLHPFLAHLISAGCQRMHPKFAIQDAILTQCSGLFKEDNYCNNIYLL